MARTPFDEELLAVYPKTSYQRKLEDPWPISYSICEFSGINYMQRLGDLSASINLMPYSVWKNLSLPELTPTCMTLELADRSISEPIGIAEDVYVTEFLRRLALIDVYEGENNPFVLAGEAHYI
ncbi:hypothetical protein Tco_0938353 [Tanacetum coccineum]|uniref:Uncharacterized protein n=1 Tax=Tanacetum coccineum TaxID=301880 RepID=A0ABQ5DJL9_9ASTR